MDGTAQLLNGQGRVLATLESFSDESEARASRGMGRFHFTPTLGESYRIQMVRPHGAQGQLQLPAVRLSGVALHVPRGVLRPGEPLQLELHNRGTVRDLVISVFSREVLTALDRITLQADASQKVTLPLNQTQGGVYRVNVAEKRVVDGQTVFLPLAERLFYRHPAQHLALQLSTVQEAGKPIQLVIENKNEKQEPSPGYFTVVGVNKALLQMAEAATLRRLPAHFYVAQEVRHPEELEFADFFLSQHPSAETALDLLLGVQGWRRFVANPITSSQLQTMDSGAEPQTDTLPLTSMSNRQEMLAHIQEEAQKQLQKTRQAQEYAQLLQHLEQTRLRWKQLQHHEPPAATQPTVPDSTVLQEKENSWLNYRFWWNCISVVLLITLALTSLVVIVLQRSVLPAHLRNTLGCLGLLALAGAIWLGWSMKRIDEEKSVAFAVGTSAAVRPEIVTKPEEKADQSAVEPA
ncbi:MAG TPA: hypothetical protein PKD72_14755, partial [Gemmatales bacterium]|nr:hypothetical protein [Gemmatales bacterium]